MALTAETLAFLNAAKAGVGIYSYTFGGDAWAPSSWYFAKCFVENRSVVDALYSPMLVQDKHLKNQYCCLERHDLQD